MPSWWEQAVIDAVSKALAGTEATVAPNVANLEDVKRVAAKLLAERGQNPDALSFEQTEEGIALRRAGA
jgi:hypothetical protein